MRLPTRPEPCLRYGSVCSGIEAVSVAWHALGLQAAWFAEIDPFPCAVLARHYPQIPNHGDMARLPVQVLSGQIEAPELLVGGTPCQAFSVAGMRRGLDDPRGALTLKYVELADAHASSLLKVEFRARCSANDSSGSCNNPISTPAIFMD